jgi:hypothetical protein
MRTVVAVLAAGAAGVMALAGCGSQPAESLQPETGREPTARRAPADAPALGGRSGCRIPAAIPDGGPDQRTPAPKQERLPAGFTPVEIYVCTETMRSVPGDGDWMVRQVRQVVQGGEALVATLRRPDRRAESGTEVACTLELPFVPDLRLVDRAGRVLYPRVPTDQCGKPQAEVMRAYEALKLETVAEDRLRRVQSEQAKTTGCPDGWKDMIAIEAPRAKPGGPGPVFGRSAPDGSVCVYQVRDRSRLAGMLVNGRALSGSEWADLNDRLAAARPAAACNRPHTRFALVRAGQQAVYVELDGCRRIQTESGRPMLRQADAALVALVERLARAR